MQEWDKSIEYNWVYSYVSKVFDNASVSVHYNRNIIIVKSRGQINLNSRTKITCKKYKSIHTSI